MKFLTLAAGLLTILVTSACNSDSKTMNITDFGEIPMAPARDTTLTLHGIDRVDPWFWLRERENPEVIAYLQAENAYLDKIMAPQRALRDSLFDEMLARIQQTDMSVPFELRGYVYYTRFEEGQEYPIYCRKSLPSGNEEILLNVNEIAEGLSYCQVTGLSISTNNNLLAYGLDNTGRRQYTLFIKDLTTGDLLEDKVENTDGNYVWANDNKTLFYDRKDEVTLRSDKVYSHYLGSPAFSDMVTFHEKNEAFSCYVRKSKDEKYIFISTYSTLSSEHLYISADSPEATFRTIYPRQRDMRYDVEHYNGSFIMRTNHEAKNFKLVKSPMIGSNPSNWETLIPHNPAVLLEDYEIFYDFLVTTERKKGLVTFQIRPWNRISQPKTIEFPEPTYDAYAYQNPAFNTNRFRYSYTSLITPASVFELNMENLQSELLKQQEVLGGYEPSNYVSERLWAKAADGTKIPVSIVYRKDRKPGGPMLQYGYGSYGMSLDAFFSSARLSLLDRGWAFAIAHIRGGQEMGREWYEDGKLLKKMNTFTDFINVGEFLIESGLTSPGNLYAMGGSAGGLLMGAVVNIRPDLYNGIVAQVPFVDVVTTMLDTSIPLTTGEFDEWGNPAKKEYFEYMLSYSPYDNVVAQDYPNILITTGFHDSQVQYWEPAKWVAKLRHTKTDSNLLLFHCEMDAGHGGKSGRFQRLHEVALEYAFLLRLAAERQAQ